LDIDHNLTVASDGATNLSMQAAVSEVNEVFVAQDTAIDSMTVNTTNPANFLGSSVTTIATAIVDPTNTNFDEGVLTSNLDATGVSGLTIPALDVVNTMNTQGVTVTSPTGIGGYALIAGQVVSTGNIFVGGDTNIANEINSLSSATLEGATVISSCNSQSGNCPDITEEPQACVILGTC
jgi:hypothetical protein